MGKESLSGTNFYKSKGLVAVVVRVRKSIRDRYTRKALKQKRSLQYLLEKVVTKNAPK